MKKNYTKKTKRGRGRHSHKGGYWLYPGPGDDTHSFTKFFGKKPIVQEPLVPAQVTTSPAYKVVEEQQQQQQQQPGKFAMPPTTTSSFTGGKGKRKYRRKRTMKRGKKTRRTRKY